MPMPLEEIQGTRSTLNFSFQHQHAHLGFLIKEEGLKLSLLTKQSTIILVSESERTKRRKYDSQTAEKDI